MEELSMDFVFFVLEIIGAISFSISGALTAIKKNMDVFGACVLGMTTAIGGGIMRDLILGVNPPVAFINPTQAIIGFTLPVIFYLPKTQKILIPNTHKSHDVCLLIADSIGLGVFTVVGVSASFDVLINPNVFTAVFLGAMTGIGGGILRDTLSLTLPKVFVKHFYACASILGALVTYFSRFLFGILASTILGIIVVLVLRILASTLHWKLPKPNCNFQ